MAKATKEVTHETTTTVPEKVLTKTEVQSQFDDLLKQLNEAQTKVVMLQGALKIAEQQLDLLSDVDPKHTNGVKNDG